MIDLKKINEKFQSLNDRINDIEDKFGEEIVNELMLRVETSLKSFLVDFEELSSKSFSIYWDKQKRLAFTNDRKIGSNLDNEKNVPKFISDYNNKDNKK